MTAAVIIVDFEVVQQSGQMVKAPDHRDPSQPLVLERKDRPLGDGD